VVDRSHAKPSVPIVPGSGGKSELGLAKPTLLNVTVPVTMNWHGGTC
jgi:hypothetical protein